MAKTAKLRTGKVQTCLCIIEQLATNLGEEMKRCHWAISMHRPSAIVSMLFWYVVSMSFVTAPLHPMLTNPVPKMPKAASGKNAAPNPGTAESSTPSPGKKRAKQAAGEHRHHEPIPAKRQIMGLSSLTDKQKQQINAIYSENAEQFKALGKQMYELRMSEWKKIQPVLTADQLSELGAKGQTGGKSEDSGSDGGSSRRWRRQSPEQIARWRGLACLEPEEKETGITNRLNPSCIRQLGLTPARL